MKILGFDKPIKNYMVKISDGLSGFNIYNNEDSKNLDTCIEFDTIEEFVQFAKGIDHMSIQIGEALVQLTKKEMEETNE